MNGNAILITGGTGKIGRELVRHFLERGWYTAFISRKKENIEEVMNNLDYGYENRLLGVCADISEAGFESRVLSHCIDNAFYPNALVNCARDIRFLKIGENGVVERSDWIGEFTVDVIAAYDLSMALTNLPGSRLSSIVNISSMYGIVAPNPLLYDEGLKNSPVHYGVCKAALIHLTKELAVRLAPQNIRVNAISFGGVEGRVDEAFKSRYARLCPLGKMLTEEDLGGSVEFLASEQSRGITGHNLVVDGGWSVW